MGENSLKRLIILLLCTTSVAVGVAVWAVFLRDDNVVLAPDYAPPREEQNAREIPGDTGEKMDVPEGGGSVSLTYSRDVDINLAGESASLVFANPGKSNRDMVLQIVIQGNVIVQTDTLKPGNQVTQLPLLKGAAKKLSPGVYDGNFAVFYYHPETGEKAVVNTEIPVKITVE